MVVIASGILIENCDYLRNVRGVIEVWTFESDLDHDPALLTLPVCMSIEHMEVTVERGRDPGDTWQEESLGIFRLVSSPVSVP